MPYKDKTCRNCETTFTPTTPSQQYCRKPISHVCPTCETNIVSNVCETGKKMRTYCSPECANTNPETQRKRETTIETKYGVKNIMELDTYKRKVEATQKENNDGVYAFNTPEQKQTMINRYGGTTPMASKTVKRKVEVTQKENNDGVYAFNTPKQRQTMIDRYGSPGILGDPEKYEQHEATMLKKYGVKKISSDPEWAEKIVNTIIEKHGKLFGNTTISKINQKFAEQLKTMGLEVVFEKRIGNSFYDIAVETHNLLIELNPTVTHNSTIPFTCLRNKCAQPCPHHSPIPQNYHYRRAQQAKQAGYTLIQIYDWDNPTDVIEKIRNHTGTPSTKMRASKLVVKQITQQEANRFLNVNHSQRGSKKQTHCYGLFDATNTLVSVMTFSKPRFNNQYEYELNRYATKRGIRIYGGASKMFKYFIGQTNPTNVISYVDFNHTTNPTTYLNHLGFVEKNPTGPALVWSKLRTPKVVKQTSLNKVGADRLLGTTYGKEHSNEEIMLSEGYVKIYTAGNRVYVWDNPNR